MKVPNRLLVLAVLLPAMNTASAIQRITLSNGDMLSGAIVSQDEKTVTFAHAVLGRLVIPSHLIAGQSLQEPPAGPAPTPTPAATLTELDERESALTLFGRRFLAGWDKHIAGGFAGSTGNSETVDVNLSAKAAFEDATVRTNFDSAYFVSRSRKGTTKNQLFAEMTQDWLSPESRWFYFGRGRYEFDSFGAWDHRISTSAGAGYAFADNEQRRLRARAGFGLNRTVGSEDDKLTPEAVLGVEARWEISKGHAISASTTIFPDFGEPGEFRAVSSADWTMKVTPRGDLSLTLGLADEYQSAPEGRAEANDFDYFGRLGYDF